MHVILCDIAHDIFSKAGKVVAARISNIKPKNVDMILLLSKNIEQLLCIYHQLLFWHSALIYRIFSYF